MEIETATVSIIMTAFNQAQWIVEGRFADADLVAAPIRLIVSQKNLANNAIEVKYRVNDMDTSSMPGTFGVDTYVADVQRAIQKLSGK